MHTRIKSKYKPLSFLALFFLAATITVTADSAAFAEVTIDEQQQFYDVKGSSIGEINDQMFDLTPVVLKGRKFFGGCQDDVKLQFTCLAELGLYRAKALSITLTSTFRMPRWVDYLGAPAELQTKWNDFYGHLSEHEYGHRRIDAEAAQDIDREAAKIRRPSCQELKNAIEDTAQGILKRAREENEEYDTTTENGFLQDAVLHEL